MNLKQHLNSRYFDYTRYSGVFLDEVESTVFLPLWNLSGQMVGYQQYSPSKPKAHFDDPKLAKYFTWVTKPAASKNAELAVFGLETLDYNKPLFLTEGIFDACRLNWNGFSAVAVLSNNPKHLGNWLSLLPVTTVAVCDGDVAGKQLAKFGDRAILLPVDRDVGDLTEDQFNSYFSEYK